MTNSVIESGVKEVTLETTAMINWKIKRTLTKPVAEGNERFKKHIGDILE